MTPFQRLLALAAENNFSAEYLTTLAKYLDTDPPADKALVFYARYLMDKGKFSEALPYLTAAYGMRKASGEIWRQLANCYLALGDKLSAAFFQGLLRRVYNKPLTIDIEGDRLEDYLEVISQAMTMGSYPPILGQRAYWSQQGLTFRPHCLAGEFLHGLDFHRTKSEYEYWVGVYDGDGSLDGKGNILEMLCDSPQFLLNAGAGFVFDIMKAKVCQGDITVSPAGEVILPIAGSKSRHLLRLDGQEALYIGKWAFSFLRLSKPTRISSEAPFAIGEPIRLGHSPARKKLVLNILLDAFSWGAEKAAGFKHVPHIEKFFSQGVIFDHHFSLAEYTFPAFAAIESGLHLHHSQIFNENLRLELDPSHKTLSEKMKELGYYCVNVLGGGDGLYNGSSRGYDRLLTAHYTRSTYEGVERTIRQLEAFGECDQFLLLHSLDTHPWRLSDYQLPVVTQAKLPLADRITGALSKEASVRLPNTAPYAMGNLQNIEDTDRALGVLFDYLEKHYCPEEYVVTLYSDHGTAVHDAFPYTFSENQGGAALMLRGAGVPSVGHVSELVSSLDIYPILAHIVGFTAGDNIDGNLPAVFGGRAREYVISNSIFPGHPYQLCIRTMDYEYQFRTHTNTEYDGTANMQEAHEAIFRRKTGEIVTEPELFAYFRRLASEHTKSFDNRGETWPDPTGNNFSK